MGNLNQNISCRRDVHSNVGDRAEKARIIRKFSQSRRGTILENDRPARGNGLSAPQEEVKKRRFYASDICNCFLRGAV